MFQRPMHFAGSWYPGSREACLQEIETYWAEAPHAPAHDARIGVVPHAGWMFSGRLAAEGFQALADEPDVDLVVVLGGHLHADDPVAAMTQGEWHTPFGSFFIHRECDSLFRGLEPLVFETERRAVPDNSVEVQLPFAKYKYPRAELLPVRVPPAPVAMELGRRLADYVRRSGLDAVVVASTDLTHYGPQYGFEPMGRGIGALNWVREENDPALIRAIEAGDGREILEVARRRRAACSIGAVVAANEVARDQGLRFRRLAYGTSADVAGDAADHFVGYLAGVYA